MSFLSSFDNRVDDGERPSEDEEEDEDPNVESLSMDNSGARVIAARATCRGGRIRNNVLPAIGRRVIRIWGTAVFADAIIAAEIVTAILAFVNFLCHKLLLFFFIEVDGFFLDFDFLAGSDFFTGDHLGILIGETKGKADEGDGEDRYGDNDDDVGVRNLRKN